MDEAPADRRPPIAILADDLTGACDAAAPFAARGAPTVVYFEPPAALPDDASVVAVDLDSRRYGRRTAATRHLKAARALRGSGAERAYKKVDSTLRGHPWTEIVACRWGWGASLSVLCPAFPGQGRLVRDGRLLVGQEDRGPVARLAGIPPNVAVPLLGVAVAERGAAAVATALETWRIGGTSFVIADATTDGHLAALATAANLVGQAPLLAGSAGLAGALAALALPKPATEDRARDTARRAVADGPWLVVAGSQTAATGAQIAELERDGSTVISLKAQHVAIDRLQADRAGERAARALEAGKTVVLRLVVAGGTESGSAQSEDRAARALGRVCRATVRRSQPAGLFLTGGLTARACLLALGARGLRLAAEPLPGIAAGRAIEGRWEGRPVITKAGGFGGPDAIRRLVMGTA
jgi:D-threonate/D-erythronate kinase